MLTLPAGIKLDNIAEGLSQRVTDDFSPLVYFYVVPKAIGLKLRGWHPSLFEKIDGNLRVLCDSAVKDMTAEERATLAENARRVYLSEILPHLSPTVGR